MACWVKVTKDTLPVIELLTACRSDSEQHQNVCQKACHSAKNRKNQVLQDRIVYNLFCIHYRNVLVK